MKRLDIDRLEALAFHHNAHVEVDREENIAVAVIQGVSYYAALPPAIGGGQ